jgi:predicted RNase H-like HicB family nuclease
MFSAQRRVSNRHKKKRKHPSVPFRRDYAVAHFRVVLYFVGVLVPISKIKIRRDEDGVWIAKSELLARCHAHGKERSEAVLNFQLAAKAHLEALMETGRPIPAAFRDKFVLVA